MFSKSKTNSNISTQQKLIKIGMNPSTCSLSARLVLGVFDGARILESEHILGSLVLWLDARRVLGEHQGITKWYKRDKITALKAEKSSKFTVDISRARTTSGIIQNYLKK